MRLDARRPLLALLALLLICGLPVRSSALDLISEVSKERAKELGITVRSQPSAQNDVWLHEEWQPERP